MPANNLWNFTRQIIPVRSFSAAPPEPVEPVDVPEVVSLRWGGPSDFTHVIEDELNRQTGPEIKLKDPGGDAPKYARILRAGVKVTTRLVRIEGDDPDTWAKVRRFERMEWKTKEPIRRKRLDESQRYRHMAVDLRFDLHPPPAEEKDEGE